MPRARCTKTYPKTAAIPQDSGSGCFSGFVLVPFTVLIISFLLGAFALNKANLLRMDSMPNPAAAGLSPIFRREVLYWSNSIIRWASASNLDPNLVATIMQIESCGDARALSNAGAMGLFQVMPFHFQPGDDPYNPDTNAARGLSYLARSLAAANGDVRLAMAGYNGGIGVIPRAEWTWSAQTKRYIQYGLPIYHDAVRGTNPSHAVGEWYSRYGVSLCSQASQRLGLP
ncbi:MAG: transglycosylase SLT domain-containing protein [Chloroflexi bacterium]|nr:transglycosylase SLT domain-containing protein [Chloroflexota bacterium]